MKKSRLFFFLALVITYQLINVSTLLALDWGFANEDGGQPGAFLSYGAGARSLGMGKTFVGVADDASATYWNPAGLAQLKQNELTALHASLYERTGYSFVSYGQPLKTVTSHTSLPADVGGQAQVTSENIGTIGVALVNLNSTGFQLRDELNNEQGEAGVNETAAILSYGKTLPLAVSSWRLAVGANAKFINQNIDAKSDTGFGADIGVLWKVVDNSQLAVGSLKQILKPLSVGFSLQNIIAPRIKLIENTDKYPLALTLGLGYKLLNDKLLLALDMNKTENRQLKFHLGSEYTIAKMFSIRTGIDETEFACGAGMKWSNYSIDYAFAYHDAWKGHEDLGASHRFGLTVRWGSIKQSQVTSHTSQVISEQIQVTSNQPVPTRSSESQVTSHRSQVTGHRSQVSSEKQEEEMMAKAEVLANAEEVSVTNGHTTQNTAEEELKEKVKEAIEKETGEEVKDVEIEKIEEIIPAESKQAISTYPTTDTSAGRQLINLSTYTVKQGDCLWTIAGKPEIYNNPWNWILIYEANKEQLKNPDLIYPEQELKIPPKNR